MSHGPGHIERTIKQMVDRACAQRKRRIAFEAWDIAREAYPPSDAPDVPALHRQWHSKQVAVLRAMHSFVRKNPNYVLINGRGAWPTLLVPKRQRHRWE
jgi:hypothetical protein